MTNQPHAMVNSAWSKPALCNLEASTGAQYEILFWYNDVVEAHLAMAACIVGSHIENIKSCATWRIKYAEHTHCALNAYARRVHRYDNHALLLMTCRARVRLAYYNGESAAWIGSTRDIPELKRCLCCCALFLVPFVPINRVTVTVVDNARANVRRIA